MQLAMRNLSNFNSHSWKFSEGFIKYISVQRGRHFERGGKGGEIVEKEKNHKS